MKVSIKADSIGQVISAETASVTQHGEKADVLSVSRNQTSPTASSGPIARRDVFISYSHEDAPWAERLKKAMAPLHRDTAHVWWDRDIKPGDRWKEEIDAALASTRVALLLVSSSFFASEFIIRDELPYLLERAGAKEIRLVWVLLEDCAYRKHPLNEYQAAHDVSCPLVELGEAEQKKMLIRIAERIADALA